MAYVELLLVYSKCLIGGFLLSYFLCSSSSNDDVEGVSALEDARNCVHVKDDELTDVSPTSCDIIERSDVIEEKQQNKAKQKTEGEENGNI